MYNALSIFLDFWKVCKGELASLQAKRRCWSFCCFHFLLLVIQLVEISTSFVENFLLFLAATHLIVFLLIICKEL